MTLFEILVQNFLLLLALFSACWVYCSWRSDVSFVDLLWGPAFAIVGIATYLRTPASERAWLLLLIVTVWGVRLGGYLTWRKWGKEEDFRYQEMRRKHGVRFALVSLFTVFLLQAILAWIISLPVQVGIFQVAEIGWIAWLGTCIWLLGLAFESIGDFQLARFKLDPANQGKVLDSGLWRYTRHPNYFGDFVVWWGIYLVAFEAETGWWTVLGPVLMSVLLIRISGVSLLEKSLKNRIEGYQDYLQSTSSFFPWPPQRGAS